MDPKTGLYSKAAKLIRSLPQEKGTAEQMIAAAKKLGLKQAELEHAKPPSGPITREELAKHFERSLPKVLVDQFGDQPPAPAKRTERATLASPSVVDDEDTSGAEPQYADYKMDNGSHYRERLLKLGLNEPQKERLMLKTGVAAQKRQLEYEKPIYGGDENHPALKDLRDRIASGEAKLAQMGGQGHPKYQSSHWSGHPNVLAHIRLQDRSVGEDRDAVRPIAEKLAQALGVGVRDLASGATSVGLQRGVITPQEAASLSRVMRWRNGYDQAPGIGKRLLHVEELQSDWAQEGRDMGFYDPEKPFQLYDWNKNKSISNHATEDEAVAAAKAFGPEATLSIKLMNTGRPSNPQTAPYVTNTQHWTDLALKNVLQEAALGGYDGIVFTPGQAQADRYGLEKTVDSIKYFPEDRTLSALKGNSTKIAKQDVWPEDLPSLIGKELSEKLLHPDSVRKSAFDGSTYHMLEGDEMKVGGGGMKGYYDQIVPKAVMRLAQSHDPDIQPGEPVDLPGGYQGFHLPMTDKLRQGITNEGFPAMRRGGRVDDALALTRRFTKDGAGAMMQLKS